MFERSLFFIKYFGLFLGFIVTVIQPKFFSGFFSIDDFALLIVLFGISNYLLLFDGGISKPLYPILRKRFLSGQDINTTLSDAINFYNFILILIFIVFSIAIYLYSILMPNNLSAIFFLSFSIFIAINILITFYRNIFIAIDEYIWYEKLDVYRKSVNILLLLLLFVDDTFVLSMLSGSILLAIAYFSLLRKLSCRFLINKRRFAQLNIKKFISFYKKHWPEAVNSFYFSINELLIYNVGYIVFPIFLTSYQVVLFGLWHRLFSGIAMWLRGIPDISIHRITRAYFSNDFYTAKKYALLTLLLCTTLLFFVMGFYMSFKVAIFDFWVGENFLFSKYFDFALFLMLFANIFQHMAGTFLLSIGGHFELMKTISYYTMIATLLCLILLSAYSFSIDKIVVVLSIVYSIASLVYFYHLFEELWQKR